MEVVINYFLLWINEFDGDFESYWLTDFLSQKIRHLHILNCHLVTVTNLELKYTVTDMKLNYSQSNIFKIVA